MSAVKTCVPVILPSYPTYAETRKKSLGQTAVKAGVRKKDESYWVMNELLTAALGARGGGGWRWRKANGGVSEK